MIGIDADGAESGGTVAANKPRKDRAAHASRRDHPRKAFMTIEPVSVNTEFGTITINNELPDTVTLAVDDQIGAQRVLVLQIDEAYQVVDAVQNAIRDALTRPSPSFQVG
ncbi:hypothetical protein [Rhodococcus phenolicus]|uniref:hypothetical protein n=1 Tax=Rhodococcus phenolicus TaxID=263849 RepID=UPI00082AFE86|nr:hypothetical protein [Rhodococcus phenolicus]